jgi:hypothetical protein
LATIIFSIIQLRSILLSILFFLLLIRHFLKNFGLYAGTHIALSPAFRPGITCGFSFKREEIFAVYDGIEQRIRYSPYEINPYIGLSIHLFVFSFILTNEDVGGGLNFSFKM